MLRTVLNDALKASIKLQEKCAMRTIRLILASIKDQDICARTEGEANGISDDKILAMLQTMVKQRHESIKLYEEGGRLELAEQEQEEIQVIQSFMPKQLEGHALDRAIRQAIDEIGARDMKDMGKTMKLLKQRYPGRMDFSKASGKVREALV